MGELFPELGELFPELGKLFPELGELFPELNDIGFVKKKWEGRGRDFFLVEGFFPARNIHVQQHTDLNTRLGAAGISYATEAFLVSYYGKNNKLTI